MKKIEVQKQLKIVVFIMMLVILATISLAWIFYPEPYDPINQYISDLGALKSISSLDNTASMIIMAIGFGLTSLIGLVITFAYVKFKELEYKPVKFFWAFSMAIGSVFVAIPKDSVYYPLHYFGAFTFIISFAILNVVWQTYHFYREHDTGYGELKPADEGLGQFMDFLMVFLVFLSIIIYLSVFVLEQIDIRHEIITGALTQKIVLGSCILAVLVLDREDM